jgi:hypothetical protein
MANHQARKDRIEAKPEELALDLAQPELSRRRSARIAGLHEK